MNHRLQKQALSISKKNTKGLVPIQKEFASEFAKKVQEVSQHTLEVHYEFLKCETNHGHENLDKFHELYLDGFIAGQMLRSNSVNDAMQQEQPEELAQVLHKTNTLKIHNDEAPKQINWDELKVPTQQGYMMEKISSSNTDGQNQSGGNMGPAEFKYAPSTVNLKEQYEILLTLCDERLSPAKVYLVRNKQTDETFVMKAVDKSKLFGNEQLFLARQECAIQSMFTDCEYITKIFAYTETEEEIISIMECIKDASWLEKKIDERKREIKNERKLRQIARDILNGLKALHDADFIHADLKIQNILASRPTKDMKA